MSNDHWNTPPEIVESVREVLGSIDMDPCSNAGSVIGADFECDADLGHDGLSVRWGEFGSTSLLNPPYSGSGVWLERCAEESASGMHIVALVNVCTATNYWAEHVWPHAAAICFPKGRIAFLRDGKPVKGNRYEQALILYSDSLAVRERFVNTMSKLGQVVLPVRGEAA